MCIPHLRDACVSLRVTADDGLCQGGWSGPEESRQFPRDRFRRLRVRLVLCQHASKPLTQRCCALSAIEITEPVAPRAALLRARPTPCRCWWRQLASTSIRRTSGLPLLVLRPRRCCSALEFSPGNNPRKAARRRASMSGCRPSADAPARLPGTKGFVIVQARPADAASVAPQRLGDPATFIKKDILPHIAHD